MKWPLQVKPPTWGSASLPPSWYVMVVSSIPSILQCCDVTGMQQEGAKTTRKWDNETVHLVLQKQSTEIKRETKKTESRIKQRQRKQSQEIQRECPETDRNENRVQKSMFRIRIQESSGSVSRVLKKDLK